MKKSFFKIFGVSALFATVASQSFAQDAPALVPTDSVFILNSLLFLVGGFLVFWNPTWTPNGPPMDSKRIPN